MNENFSTQKETKGFSQQEEIHFVLALIAFHIVFKDIVFS